LSLGVVEFGCSGILLGLTFQFLCMLCVLEVDYIYRHALEAGHYVGPLKVMAGREMEPPASVKRYVLPFLFPSSVLWSLQCSTITLNT
jgi:hypothetical protein